MSQDRKTLEVTIYATERTRYGAIVQMTQAEFDALDKMSDEEIFHKYIDRLNGWMDSDSEEIWDITHQPISGEQS